MKNHTALLAVLAMFIATAGSVAAQTTPSLIYLSPSSGPAGSNLTIIGSGFADRNDVHFDFGGFQDIFSPDGVSLAFSVPAVISGCTFWTDQTKPCLLPATPVVPGFHQIRISNSHGASNDLIFTVSQVLGTTTAQTVRLVLAGQTVYEVLGGERRGFTSPAVFFSHGYSFAQVVKADPSDLALPAGKVLTYREGTLVKSPNDPTVYIVTGEEKRPFTSGSVFTKLGYQFSSVLTDDSKEVAKLPPGLPIASVSAAHPVGSLVNFNGTICKIIPTGRVCIPSQETFASHGYSFKEVVPANDQDLALPETAILASRPPVVALPVPPAPIAGTVPTSTTPVIIPLPPPAPAATSTAAVTPPTTTPSATASSTISVSPPASAQDIAQSSPTNDRTIPTLTYFAEISGFNDPAGINISPSGQIYVANYHGDNVKVFDSNRNLLRTLGSTRGSADGMFSEPWDVAFDSLGNALVSDTNNSRIQVFNPSGAFVRKWNTPDAYQGLARFDDQTIYATGRKIKVFDSQGAETATRSLGENYYPRNVAADANGRIYYSNWGNVSGCCTYDANNFFTVYSPTGALVKKVSLDYQPLFIDVDDKFRIWIVDHMNAKVKLYDSTGTYLTEFTFPGISPASESIVGLEVHDSKLYISSHRTDKVYIYDIGAVGSAPASTVTPPPPPAATPPAFPTPSPTPSPTPTPSPSPSSTTATSTPSTSPSPPPPPPPPPSPSPSPATLTPPSSVDASPRSTWIMVSWPATGAAKYKIYRCVADFGCGGAAAYSLIYTATTDYLAEGAITAGTTYRYKVYSCDDSNNCSSTGTESNTAKVN